MSGVFDENKTELITYRTDLISLYNLSGIINGDDSLCLIGDMCSYAFGIYVIGFRIDIREYGFCPAVKNAVSGCCECDGRGDDFIALFYAGRNAGTMKSTGPAVDHYRIFCAGI